MAATPDVHENVIGMKVDGKPIFHPEKSLGIARKDMPQIPGNMRDEFLSNYEHELVAVDPTTLNPTQNELDSFKVGLSATGAIHPDAPIVSSDHYIIDGHHHWAGSVVRAQLDSSERITVHSVSATRDELLHDALSYDARNGIEGEGLADKLAAALLKKKDWLTKAKKPIPPLGIDSNPKLQRVEKRLKESAKELLGKVGEFVAERFKEIMEQQDDSHHALADADNLASLIDLSDILNLHEPLLDELSVVIEEQSRQALASVGVGDVSVLVDQVSAEAVRYAETRAAELVSLEGDESLVTSTRAMIRDTIANGLEENIGTPAIADELRQSYGFSELRAETIATTEVSMANAHAKKTAWDALDNEGAELVKEWFISADEGVCPLCEGNADEGEIPYDQDFSSGDEMEPGHPRCRCAVAVRVVDPGNSAAETADEGEEE
jgi:hypothetical protein